LGSSKHLHIIAYIRTLVLFWSYFDQAQVINGIMAVAATAIARCCQICLCAQSQAYCQERLPAAGERYCKAHEHSGCGVWDDANNGYGYQFVDIADASAYAKKDVYIA